MKDSTDSLLQGSINRYLFGLAMVVVAFVLRLMITPWTGKGAPFVLFFGATLVTSLVAGMGPSIGVLIVSLPLAAYMFVVKAGYSYSQAAFQAFLYAIDGVLVVYLIDRVNKARRASLRANDELRKANEQITATAQHTREIIELAPDAFFQADLDARILDVNEAACRMLGYEREELIGKTFFDLIPAADAARLQRVKIDLLVPGNVDRAEWVQLRRDGTPIPVEVSSNILTGGRWQAFARDITARRQLEDERQVFVSLLDNSSDFIGIADPSGKPLYLNPAGRKMIGLPQDLPIESTQIAEYYPPEERTFATEVILKTMMERGRWSGETRFRHWRTGEAIPVSDEHFLIRDASGKRILGMATISRDITETRRIYDQLRESEERFRLIVDEAPIGMALVALDGRFVRVNRALCNIVGYEPSELTGLTFQAITHPDDLDTDLALAGQLARGEIAHYQLPKRYLRKDGSVVEILLHGSALRAPNGSPLYYIAQIEDVTERNAAEEALRLSEAKFSGIISISADAIISIDAEQRITLFNDGAENIFGYSRQEVLGQPLAILIPERLQAIHREHVQRFVRSSPAARRMGERITTIAGRRKSGAEFPADAAISKLEVGGTVVLTVALRDITEQQRREREIQRAVQMRDQVLGIVAHDLRNPLGTIVMELSILRRRSQDRERRDVGSLDNISRAARRMEHLIHDLLDVALLESGELTVTCEPLSASALVTEAVEMQRPLAASANLEIQLDIEKDVPGIYSDHHRLLQVFENLIGNAIKFTPAGGTITIGASSANDGVLFWVKDTGCGIDAENLPHIFDRFWQATSDAQHLGAGLGLPITKGIIEAHGGQLWVESTPGRGTTFFFSIPREQPDIGRAPCAVR